MRRMDRYKEDTTHISRLNKNQELYQNLTNNTIYTNITDVTNSNAFEIKKNEPERSSHPTREAYQQMKKYQNIEKTPHTKKELEDFNFLYKRRENKIYDINSVLEEARKNKQEKDVLDEKRKLKNNAYNILSGINKEELEKYREEKKRRLTTPEEEGLRELIDTIASKTLAGEIDKATSVDLLSDLMATNILDKVDNIEKINEKQEKEKASEEKIEEVEDKLSLSKQILDTEEIKEINEKVEKKEEKEELKGKDPEFYTRSMDLSDKDFDLSDEFKEKQLPLAVKILLFLLILTLIAVAAFFIYQKI